MAQQPPDVARVPQPHQGHGRPRLPFGQLIPGRLAHQRPVPDRSHERRSVAICTRPRQRDRPISVGGQLAAAPQVSLRVEAVTCRPLEPRISNPDRVVASVRLACLDQLDECRRAADRVKVGVLLDVVEVRVTVVDGRAE